MISSIACPYWSVAVLTNVLQSDLFCARRHAVCRPMLAGFKSSSTVRIQVCRGRPRGLFQVAGTPLIDTGAHDYMVHVYLASALEACSRRCPIQYFTCNVAAWKTRLCVFGGLCVDMWRLVHQWSFLLFWLSFDCFWRLVDCWYSLGRPVTIGTPMVCSRPPNTQSLRPWPPSASDK